MENDSFMFPDDFLWGASSSSHQVEGNNVHNDWYEWEQTGKLKEKSGLACDHWNRFREDFKLAKSLHHNAHRFSIEWSRVEPEEGRFDEQVLRHYQEVIDCLRQNGLEPIVTLNHFTLPIWLARKGGWLSKQAPVAFARYAKKIYESVGNGVHTWILLNEPMVYVYKGYLSGEWPPGDRDYKKLWPVVSGLLLAHVMACEAIREAAARVPGSAVRIGIAHHTMLFEPCSAASWKDRLSVHLRNLLFNHLFIKALMRGRINIPGFFKIRLPKKCTLDFIGINYYTRNFVHNRGLAGEGLLGETCMLAHHKDTGQRNLLGWEDYPKGFEEILKDFSRYKLPLLITESGTCTNNDAERLDYLKGHLTALAKAVKNGAPVIGYLYWSLLDNFEWADGYSPRFGLIEVDYKTQERKIRDSARWYAQICRESHF